MKQKILFYATHPNQNNGYARIAHRLTNYLADFYDIYYFAFSNFNDVLIPRFIHSNIRIIDCYAEEMKKGNNDPFGYSIVKDLINEIKPDVLMIYNDVLVTCKHLNIINQIRNENSQYSKHMKVVSYLDLVYDYEKFEFVDFVFRWCDQVQLFSEHWKKNIKDMNLDTDKVRILYHGFDTEMFYKVDKLEARSKLGINPNDFVILNANRNSYRKAQDVTIAAYLKFLKMNNFNSSIKLYLHCSHGTSYGYNLIDIIKTECMKLKIEPNLILNHYILKSPEDKLSDEMINYLYNACDVGVNTCIGEGFGLCNLEHAGLEKPQIVSRVGALKDIFEDYPEFTVSPSAEYNITGHMDEHVGTVYMCSSDDFANKMQRFYENYSHYEKLVKLCSNHIRQKYDWNIVLQNLKDYLGELIFNSD